MKSQFHTSTFVPANAVLIAISIGLYVAAIFIGEVDSSVIALTIVICFSGNVIGIPLGMLASPYENEGRHFERIGQLVAGFISGYLISKIDSIFGKLDIESELVVGRIFLFFSFVVLGAVQTFVFRRYFDTRRKHESLSTETTEQENSADS